MLKYCYFTAVELSGPGRPAYEGSQLTETNRNRWRVYSGKFMPAHGRRAADQVLKGLRCELLSDSLLHSRLRRHAGQSL
ncbi:MAG: hypothetical protein V3W37_04805 [Candidatus Binatia bacterium]